METIYKTGPQRKLPFHGGEGAAPPGLSRGQVKKNAKRQKRGQVNIFSSRKLLLLSAQVTVQHM